MLVWLAFAPSALRRQQKARRATRPMLRRPRSKLQLDLIILSTITTKIKF